MNDRKALCLNMIVKNEMANLDRCLTSVAPHISCWVIGDTGSTDGTQEFIRSFFAARDIPGQLHEYPFTDFARARNEALDRARGSTLDFDGLLLLDADMELVVHAPAFSRNLAFAACNVRQLSGLTYRNIRLLRRDAQASYRGVTHEFLSVQSAEVVDLDDISLFDHATGSNRVDKYKRDLCLLTAALERERDPMMVARYVFYVANTLRDAGQQEAALRMYLRRVSLGGWRQEVFVSLLNAARLMESAGYGARDVLATYRDAALACPARAEALHGAARYCRTKGLYEQGYAFAAQGLTLARLDDALFPEDWIYDYGLSDELAVCAYWTGRYAECRDVSDRLVSEGKSPAEYHARVLQNRNAAMAKLTETGTRPPTRDRLRQRTALV